MAEKERQICRRPIAYQHDTRACRGQPGSSQRSLESLPVALGEQRRSKKVPTARQPWGHASEHFVQTCPLCPFNDRARKSSRHNLPLDSAPMRRLASRTCVSGCCSSPPRVLAPISTHLFPATRNFWRVSLCHAHGISREERIALRRQGPGNLVRHFYLAGCLAGIDLEDRRQVDAAVGSGPVMSGQEQMPASPDDRFCLWVQYLLGMTETEEMTRGEKEHGRRHPKQSRDDPATAVGFYVTYARTGQDQHACLTCRMHAAKQGGCACVI